MESDRLSLVLMNTWLLGRDMESRVTSAGRLSLLSVPVWAIDTYSIAFSLDFNWSRHKYLSSH